MRVYEVQCEPLTDLDFDLFSRRRVHNNIRILVGITVSCSVNRTLLVGLWNNYRVYRVDKKLEGLYAESPETSPFTQFMFGYVFSASERFRTVEGSNVQTSRFKLKIKGRSPDLERIIQMWQASYFPPVDIDGSLSIRELTF